MEHFLRDWREDAANKHQIDSAIFVADKVLALTDDDTDAFRLAELHFTNGNFPRAYTILSNKDLTSRSSRCKHLAALCRIRQGRFEDALLVLGDRTPSDLLMNAAQRRKLAYGDTRRNNQSKNGKNVQRLDDTSGRTSAIPTNDETRLQAGMCHLRGLCYAKQNAFDRAKECYIDAVKIDVQCFEAFDQLMKNALMSPKEEWDFLEELDFDSITTGDSISVSQQAAEMTKHLYTSRLSKYRNGEQLQHALETLSTHYKLASNPDILLSQAELLFTQCRFKEALALTYAILAIDQYNFSAIPLHLACLHEMNEKNALFLLSHDLADKYPEEPGTWLAVGVYYLAIGKIAESRRYFSKSSMMDPHFGPAWIGFAHTFAAEGEHDQAIAAYSTAARLFQGTHLPQLFLGMQNLQLQNIPLATEYLNTALELCDSDPLLLNELGVVYYHDNRYKDAITTFLSAINLAQDIDADPRSFVATRANLGHAYRRDQQWQNALDTFDEVLRIAGRDAPTFTSKAMVLLELGQAWEATTALHEALALNPQDPVAGELLNKAMEETAAQNTPFAMKDKDVEDFIAARKQDVAGRKRGRLNAAATEAFDDMEMSEMNTMHE